MLTVTDSTPDPGRRATPPGTMYGNCAGTVTVVPDAGEVLVIVSEFVVGADGLEPHPTAVLFYTSSSSASSARSMMNRKRAEASLPISSLITRSVMI